MTYCAGWKYSNSVYLFADTAITKDSAPTTTHSNFGELHAEVKGEYVEESLLKIISLSDGTAVAFAGDVWLATKIAEFIAENLASSPSLSDLLSSVEKSLGPFSKVRAVELLIARSNATGEPELICWNTVDGLDTSGSDYYQIGSLTSYHSALTSEILSILVTGKIDQDRFLPIVTAVVQSYGIHDNLIEQNIGGLIFGLRTCAGQIFWQEDTNFIIYDPNLSNMHWISAFVRDNVIVINSTQTNSVRALAHSVSTKSVQAWSEKWAEYIKNHLETDKYRYWVFISTIGKVITIVRRGNLDEQSHLVSLTKTGDGKFIIGINDELATILKKPLVERHDGSLPFRLNFKNA